MAQTPTCLLDGGPYIHYLLGIVWDCAIYSETTVGLLSYLVPLPLKNPTTEFAAQFGSEGKAPWNTSASAPPPSAPWVS